MIEVASQFEKEQPLSGLDERERPYPHAREQIGFDDPNYPGRNLDITDHPR